MGQYFIQMFDLYAAVKAKQIPEQCGIGDFETMSSLFRMMMNGVQNNQTPQQVFDFFIEIFKVHNKNLEQMKFILQMQFVPLIMGVMVEIGGVLSIGLMPTFFFTANQTIPNGMMIRVVT